MPGREAIARAMLDEFAERTGLTSAAKPRRYLWTDAFAVVTWLGMGRVDLARRLIEQVHEVLGVSRDPEHPTARGVRIGKPLPERAPEEPYDPDLEWERDGQYYHYLTKWLHALERTARATGEARYHRWAVELAQAAHRAFAHPPGAPTRLYWKMSVDLSRPLVPSMGMHDPLDGLVAMATLGLERETRELARMCEGRRWATDDPLGAGGLLLDALALARLGFKPLLAQALADAELSVAAAASAVSARLPAAHRLAFRELGLALGLHAVEQLNTKRLIAFVPLAEKLEDFWLEPAHQAAASWTEHRDINAVTLAACLAPDGALDSGPGS
ncbi:MAG TPA: hypothetical protein VGJ74_04225 [Burkholderiales bacterium]